MKVLVAPLNWGLGHAARCIPLVRKYVADGHQVLLGGKGESLVLLHKHFPNLPTVELAPLELTYSAGKSQVGAMVRALPKIVRSALLDHLLLAKLIEQEKIDLVVSDNRFGLYATKKRSKKQNFSSSKTETGEKAVRTIYMTHQLHIMLPKGWKWAEPIAEWAHRQVWKHYDEVWVPDREENGLSGALSHGVSRDPRIRFIGTLSRFEGCAGMQIESDYAAGYEVVAVLSGLEPQRSLFEKDIMNRYAGRTEQVLIVEGKVNRPPTRLRHGNITRVAHLNDTDLAAALLGARKIIARSGYSTLMDLDALGVREKTEWVATPGQSEQEYLAEWLEKA